MWWILDLLLKTPNGLGAIQGQKTNYLSMLLIFNISVHVGSKGSIQLVEIETAKYKIYFITSKTHQKYKQATNYAE